MAAIHSSSPKLPGALSSKSMRLDPLDSAPPSPASPGSAARGTGDATDDRSPLDMRREQDPILAAGDSKRSVHETDEHGVKQRLSLNSSSAASEGRDHFETGSRDDSHLFEAGLSTPASRRDKRAGGAMPTMAELGSVSDGESKGLPGGTSAAGGGGASGAGGAGGDTEKRRPPRIVTRHETAKSVFALDRKMPRHGHASDDNLGASGILGKTTGIQAGLTKSKMIAAARATGSSNAAMVRLREQQQFREKLFGKFGDEQSIAVESGPQVGDEISNLLDPTDGFKRAWDVAYLVCLAWLCLRTTFFAAFESMDGDMDLPTAVIDDCVTAFFLCDVALTFRTVVIDTVGDLIVDTRQIAVRYVTGWFAVELAVSLPWHWILGSPWMRVFRALRALRISRVEYAQATLNQWLELGDKYYAPMALAKLLSLIVLTAHLSACVWFWVAHIDGHGDDSWTTLYGVVDATPGSQWLSAVYWSFATLTTVGYGDISATTELERGFSLVMIAVGAVTFAAIVGRVTAITAEIGADAAALRKRKQQVNAFMRAHDFPRDIRERARKYYDFVGRAHPIANEAELMTDLSPSLRKSVLRHLNSGVVASVPLFKFGGSGFQATIVTVLKQVICVAGEYIYCHDEVVKDIYFVDAGQVQQVTREGKVASLLESGSFFGEVEVMDRIRAMFAMRCATMCELYRLSRDDLQEILRDFPEFEVTIRRVARLRTAIASARLAKELAAQEAAKAAEAEAAKAEAKERHGLFSRLGARVTPSARGASEAGSGGRVRGDSDAGSVTSAARSARKSTEAASATGAKGVAATPGAGGGGGGGGGDGSGSDSDLAGTHPNPNPARSPGAAFGGGALVKRFTSEGGGSRVGSTLSASSHGGKAAANDAAKTLGNIVPPPEGLEDWSDLDRRNQFEEYYEQMLRSSRALQAAEYQPQPLDLDKLELPRAVRSIVEMLAHNAHEVYVAERMAHGWKWGSERDNVRRLHPELIAWEDLPHESREYNRHSVTQILKLVSILGHRIVPNPMAQGVITDWEFGKSVPAAGLTRRFVPHPFPVKEVVLSDHMTRLVLEMSEHAHDVWAADKIAGGWSWGPTRNDARKCHNCLVPWDFLTEEEQELERSSIEQTVKMVCGLGYQFVKTDKRSFMALARLVGMQKHMSKSGKRLLEMAGGVGHGGGGGGSGAESPSQSGTRGLFSPAAASSAGGGGGGGGGGDAASPASPGPGGRGGEPLTPVAALAAKIAAQGVDAGDDPNDTYASFRFDGGGGGGGLGGVGGSSGGAVARRLDTIEASLAELHETLALVLRTATGGGSGGGGDAKA